MVKRVAFIWASMLSFLVLTGLLLSAHSLRADSTATGVALSPLANCARADLDLSLTTVNAHREFGRVTSGGTELLSFEQGTALGNVSGTVPFPLPIAAQPNGTILEAYAYVGETPPSASDTAEFYVRYMCSDQGEPEILDTCSGPCGSCPGTVCTPGSAGGAPLPGCDALVDLPKGAVMGTFLAATPALWGPDATFTTGVVIDAGKSYWVAGLDASGQFYKVLLQCSWVWVPTGSVGPTYDRTWNGTPLPTTVVK